jgi:hypothetical protein
MYINKTDLQQNTIFWVTDFEFVANGTRILRIPD